MSFSSVETRSHKVRLKSRQPAGADGILGLFRSHGAAPLAVRDITNCVVTIESEDAIPEDDEDWVAGNITGSPFSPERYITTEKLSHDMGHRMDSLTWRVAA